LRLDGARGSEGIGLGLAISKLIADALNITITLRSAPGECARFSLRVPRAD
jgi:signal transduction histidine kinase